MEIKKNSNISSIEDIIKNNVKKIKPEYENLDAFLEINPTPYIKGLDEAVALIKAHKGPIFIAGDYDCDGVLSTHILKAGLNGYFHKKPTARIPKRFTEGFGLNMEIIEEARTIFGSEQGLLITCDNGIAAIDQIAAAKEMGMKVIVTDHHLPNTDANGNRILPPADVIVDPNADDESEFKDYCGAGLAYRLMSALLNQKCDYLLVLAGIATVADVMKLHGANRYLVGESLRLLTKVKPYPHY